MNTRITAAEYMEMADMIQVSARNHKLFVKYLSFNLENEKFDKGYWKWFLNNLRLFPESRQVSVVRKALNNKQFCWEV